MWLLSCGAQAPRPRRPHSAPWLARARLGRSRSCHTLVAAHLAVKPPEVSNEGMRQDKRSLRDITEFIQFDQAARPSLREPRPQHPIRRRDSRMFRGNRRSSALPASPSLDTTAFARRSSARQRGDSSATSRRTRHHAPRVAERRPVIDLVHAEAGNGAIPKPKCQLSS